MRFAEFVPTARHNDLNGYAHLLPTPTVLLMVAYGEWS